MKFTEVLTITPLEKFHFRCELLFFVNYEKLINAIASKSMEIPI